MHFSQSHWLAGFDTVLSPIWLILPRFQRTSSISIQFATCWFVTCHGGARSRVQAHSPHIWVSIQFSRSTLYYASVPTPIISDSISNSMKDLFRSHFCEYRCYHSLLLISRPNTFLCISIGPSNSIFSLEWATTALVSPHMNPVRITILTSTLQPPKPIVSLTCQKPENLPSSPVI